MNEMRSSPDRTLPVTPFGSLISRRVLIPSERTNLVAIDKYFLVQLLGSHVSRIRFDEGWYFWKYPDIMKAVEDGKVDTARDHYISDGYYEHRMPYQITVDEGWYLHQYPDVSAAVERKEFESAQMHFETAGFREGRDPYAGFALEYGDPVYA